MMYQRPTSGRLLRRDDSPALTSFFLSDSSPMIHYIAPSPGSWTTGYALQSDGWDSTVHLTAQSDSTITFDITATSLTFLVPYFADCKSTLKLNASISVPACSTPAGAFTLQNLPRGLHHIEYTTNTITKGQDVSFWGVDATRPYDGTQWGNVTIDDAQKGKGVGGLTYVGDWTMDGDAAGAANRTLAGTGKKGASVEIVTTGSAVYLYGNTGPQYGSASITLDDNVVDQSLNFSSTWASTYQLLWFRTGLDPNRESKVVMTSLEDKRMTLDFVVITAHQDELAKFGSKPFLSTLAGKLVTFALGPLIVAILAGILLFICIRRRRQASRSANPSRSSKSKEHHESFQNLRSSYLDFGRGTTASPPNSGLTDKEQFEQQQVLRYSYNPAPSDRSVGDDLVFTYEEGKKRLSERIRSAARSPKSTYAHSAYAPSPVGTGEMGVYGDGTPIGLPSPGNSPLNFYPDRFTAISLDPTSHSGSARSSFFRPFEFLVGRSSRVPHPALLPNPHEADISLSVASPVTGLETPTSASAADAQLVEWTRATPHEQARLKSTFSDYPTSPSSQLFTSSLPLSSAGGMSPGQRFRPSDAPSGRTSISFSDVLSVIAAPPSVRDMDLRSVHTGRSGPNDGFFMPEDAVPALPTGTELPHLIPTKFNTPPLRPTNRPPPTSYPSQTLRSGSGSLRKAVPVLPPSSYSPTSPMTFTPVDILSGSPARPESTTNGSFGSPTTEAARMQSEYDLRLRYTSGVSRSSEYTTATSAARPDSSVMPFEEFVAGLKEGQRKVDADRSLGYDMKVDGLTDDMVDLRGLDEKGGRM